MTNHDFLASGTPSCLGSFRTPVGSLPLEADPDGLVVGRLGNKTEVVRSLPARRELASFLGPPLYLVIQS